MTMFGALPPGYGEADSSSGMSPEAQQALSIAAQVTGASAQTPEEIRARIENMKRMRQQVPFMAWYYDNEINRLEGRLAAVSRQTAELKDWSLMGQSVSATGILVGFALIGALIAWSDKQDRKGRKKRR